jgi:hypothetical protein
MTNPARAAFSSFGHLRPHSPSATMSSTRMVYRTTQLDPHLDEGGSLDHEPVLCGPRREAPQVAYSPHR